MHFRPLQEQVKQNDSAQSHKEREGRKVPVTRY